MNFNKILNFLCILLNGEYFDSIIILEERKLIFFNVEPKINTEHRKWVDSRNNTKYTSYFFSENVGRSSKQILDVCYKGNEAINI